MVTTETWLPQKQISCFLGYFTVYPINFLKYSIVLRGNKSIRFNGYPIKTVDVGWTI